MEERMDILEPMIIPQLGDPNFSSSFADFCNAVSKNIGRLVSIQYAKGEKGSSIYDIPINIGYDEQGQITKLGANLLNTIFGISSINTGDTWQYIDGILNDESHPIAPDVNNQKVFDEFLSAEPGETPTGITININIDDENHKAYISQPYVFIDERINALRNISENYTTWHDFSIGIYGEGFWEEGQDVDDPNTWTWTLYAVAIVPKIYYDDDIHEFCWMVNEQQTGITAQGIKGDTGDTFQIIIAKGHRGNNENTSKIYIDYIQEVDENGQETWPAVDSFNVRPGDLALVFYENPVPDIIHRIDLDPYKNAFIGKVHADAQNNRYVYIGSDNDDHCDYFESIKARNLWEIMMSINSRIVGTPRGYILPAYPGHTIPSPIENYPEETHMIYSEKGNVDGNNYSRLHIAPVKSSNTHGSSGDPATDHIGDMQVDYNVGVQGDLNVQGVVNMHNNVSVQGNVAVQGDITAQNITSLGKPWGCKIEEPMMACMSKFKNMSYSLSRLFSINNHTFTYNIEISGILELNIGKLSWFNHGYTPSGQLHQETWMFPHNAIKDYGANWETVNIGQQIYTQSDIQNTINFNNTECRNRSKLYDVVKYNIPFKLSKSVTSNSLSNSGDNIFGFNFVHNNTLWSNNDVPKSKTYDACEDWDKSKVMLRFGINGFNFTANGHLFGAAWTSTNDADGSILTTPTWTGVPPVPHISDTTNVNEENTRESCEDFDNGDITTLIKILQNIHPGDPDDSLYSICGELRYGPHDMDIKYKFDLFTRIFERDFTTWGDDSNNMICNKVEYNVELNITPFGYVSLGGTSGDVSWKVPIWNTINVIGENELTTQFDIHQTKPSNLNPIISEKYSETFSRNTDTNSTEPFNGKSGKILNGNGIESKYIISIFERYIKNSIQTYSMPDITTVYNDITSGLRIVDNNVKVCPNNISDGLWDVEESNNEKYYGWKSVDPVPYVIIPFEGYIGNWKVGGVQNINEHYLNPGDVIIGCGNLKPHNTYYPVTLNGLLMYPYTPCVISKRSSGDPLDRINDLFEDAISIDGNAQVGHYVKRGRMMGVTNGIVEGVAGLNDSED